MSGEKKKSSKGPGSARDSVLTFLPSVDEMLRYAEKAELTAKLGRRTLVELIRELLEGARGDLAVGGSRTRSEGLGSREQLSMALLEDLQKLVNRRRETGVRRVINGTGVVIHTNLGRAPLSAAARAAALDASGYSTIEYDLESGSRGGRGSLAIESIRRLTGSEDALIVNNCAAAALLILSVFARGREVLVSRGELVEIGGDFRIPDVLERSGAKLREVGTTNRTHLRDYESAISETTAMILKVHPSNYRITGFHKTPNTRDLAMLAADRGIIFYEDAGSGALVDLSKFGVNGEPVISDVIADGADIVSFSGDKLLGGPQAGIIVGRARYVQTLAKDPFFRALRVDKLITAALENTLDAYLAETNLEDLPVHRMLSISGDEIGKRSRQVLESLSKSESRANGLSFELLESRSAVGGGASPDSSITSTVIAVSHSTVSSVEIEAALRHTDPPVIARIENGKVLIDLRTVGEDEDVELARSLQAAFDLIADGAIAR